jgi:hypothetical protein
VLQNNAIVPLLSSITSIVVDVSALTDTLEIPPPIAIQPQAPIPAPLPSIPAVTTNSPGTIPVVVPAPTSLTFAPIPDILDVPSINIFDPTMAPVAMQTNSEIPSRVPSKIPVPTNATASTVPVSVPIANTDDTNREEQSSGRNGLKWWAWLLIVFGIAIIAFCGYGAYLNQQDGTANNHGSNRRGSDDGGGTTTGTSRIGMLTSTPKINVQTIKSKNSSKRGTSKASRDTEDEEDDNEEEVPYEPPTGMDQYVPPPSMTLNHTANKNTTSDNIITANATDESRFGATGLPSIPYFATNVAPDVPPPAFVNNALDDESDEEEEEENHMENDNDDDDEEIEYENDGYREEEVEYTDDEGDDEGEEVEEHDQRYDNHNHQDGEVFEDEESYYEEEDDEEDEDNTYGEDSYPPHHDRQGGGNNNHNWGEPSTSPSFGGLY